MKGFTEVTKLSETLCVGHAGLQVSEFFQIDNNFAESKLGLII
jgi:hypothetical protein